MSNSGSVNFSSSGTGSSSYIGGGLSTSASLSGYYPSITSESYTIKIDTDEAKKEILDAVKNEMKKDEDVNELLEIAKAVLLDYITKIVDKPELVISDELKKKEAEINNLKQEIETLKTRIAVLENRNMPIGGTPYYVPPTITYTYAIDSSASASTSSQTII